MDPELLPGSGIIVPDPDPAKSERACKQNCDFWTVCTTGIGHWTVVLKREWQIVVMILLFD